jgi:hypothetical protein
VRSEMLKFNWAELLILGLAQIITSSQHPDQLKSMIVTTLVNHLKSLIMYSTTESNKIKISGKSDVKVMSGQKLKKIVNNIMMVNKFLDSITQLELDSIEFAHLRLFCLFNPNKCYSKDVKLTLHYQRIALNLQTYLRTKEKSQSVHERTVLIFQALSILPSLNGKIIEKLFFNILVDFIKIDNVIPIIMNLNSGVGKVKKEKDLDLENSQSMNSDDQRYYNYSGDEK